MDGDFKSKCFNSFLPKFDSNDINWEDLYAAGYPITTEIFRKAVKN